MGTLWPSSPKSAHEASEREILLSVKFDLSQETRGRRFTYFLIIQLFLPNVNKCWFRLKHHLPRLFVNMGDRGFSNSTLERKLCLFERVDQFRTSVQMYIQQEIT